MASEQMVQPSVDSDWCAQEPIQIIGQIQSHGVLFALSLKDLRVRYVSANVGEMFGWSVDSVIGAPFASLIGSEQFARFERRKLTDDREANALGMVVGTAERHVVCTVHRQDDILIVEFELLPELETEPLTVAAQLRMFRRMEKLPTIVAMGNFVVSEVRALTGFERVMIYQFDPACNGEVIAEVTTPAFGSYLGLHFPASDIPAQARRLLLLNPLRSIADVNSAAAPIRPVSPDEPALDLTYSSLRSASSIHLQYLRNMDVASTMTVSIIVKDELWGLIACHHPQPHRVDFSVRALCELIAGFYAAQIGSRLDTRELQSQLRFRKDLADYLNVMDASNAPADARLLRSKRLMDLLEADGLIFSIDGSVFSQGTTASQTALAPVVAQLAALAVDGIASSNMLGALDPSAAAFAVVASGALYIELTPGSGDYLLLLRREVVQTVQWAGNRVKPQDRDDAGLLHPRTSFAAWSEAVRGQSLPWGTVEIENARFLREQLTVLRAAQRAHDSQERIRYLATHDALTQLGNRISLQQAIEQNIAAAGARHGSFGVLFIDLDDFKTFNDTLGHAAGDEILKIVAARILRQVRAEDFVGRLGGDEFVAVIPGANDAYAFKAAARILRAIQEPLNLPASDMPLKVTASIGLSRYPADGTTTSELLSRSDIAMYRVKVKGGNALASFTP
jgi:diguanylate cyclase (GGDEF)-like protein